MSFPKKLKREAKTIKDDKIISDYYNYSNFFEKNCKWEKLNNKAKNT